MDEGKDDDPRDTQDETPDGSSDDFPDSPVDNSPIIPRPKICPNCMTPNEEFAHLCRTCFTPLSSHATIDPIYGISARADTFSKASNAPRKPIVLVGMWLLFGPITFFCMLFAFSMLQTGNFGAILIPAAVAAIPVALLYKTTKNFVITPLEDRAGFPVGESKDDPQDYDTPPTGQTSTGESDHTPSPD
jgi:hypothetical protein